MAASAAEGAATVGVGMGALAVYRGLLSNGALVRLLAGEFASGIGNWLYLVALLIVVHRADPDPVLLGVVGAARVLPYVVLSVPAGIVADRFDRRLVLLATDVSRAAIMAVLAAVVFAGGPVAAIIGLSILATCVAPFFYPAIGAYIPSLVRDERELGPANSAATALDNLAFVIGPAVAGILVAIADLGWAFVLNAVSFVGIAVILWRLPPSIPGAADSAAGSRGERETPTLARELLGPLAGLTIVDAAASFVLGGLSVLTVVLAADRLGAGDAGTGYLNAAVGVGGLVGAVLAGALVLRRDLLLQLVVGAVVFGVGVAVLGVASSILLALVAMVVASVGSLVMEIVSTTVFQRIVPDAVRGRAIGTLSTFSRLAWSAGSFALPVAGTAVGLPPVLAVSGAGAVVATIVGVALIGGERRLAPSDEELALRRVAGLPILTGVPGAALEIAARRLEARTVAEGDVIVRQGDPADRFYVIERGSFAVDRTDPGTGAAERLRTLGPDEVFGELGLLRSAPRSATVTALTDGRVLALDGSDFLELVGSASGLSGRLMDLYQAGGQR